MVISQVMNSLIYSSRQHLMMDLSFRGVLENKARLGFSKLELGVSWWSVEEFCDACISSGMDEVTINKKLSRCLIKTQKQIALKKEHVKAEENVMEKSKAEEKAMEKSKAEEKAKEDAMAEAEAEAEAQIMKDVEIYAQAQKRAYLKAQEEEKLLAEKEHLLKLFKNAEEKKKKTDIENLPTWKIYSKYPDLFETYRFSVSSVLEFYTKEIIHEIMCLVIGNRGDYFKQWTAYWDAGSIMYNKETMMIDVSFLKTDEDRLSKIKTIRTFIKNKIKDNGLKLVLTRTRD
tara:strand:+ start:605 stop:1468 length:864 start_codon:yes stop_codon:yes gene_type:complete